MHRLVMKYLENKKIDFYAIFLLSVLISSRIYFFSNGLSMEKNPGIPHTIDYHLLKTKLLESVFYDPYQPPLMNFILGVFLKISPVNYPIFFTITHLIMSATIIILLYYSLKFLKINYWIISSLIGILILNPAFIFYENMIFYHHYVVFLFSVAFFFVIRFTKSKSNTDLFIFYLSISFITFFRTSYHYIWFVAIFLTMLFLFKNYTKQIKIAVFPFIIVMSLYVKNFMLYGIFGSSNMMGTNLFTLTTYIPNTDVLKARVENKISDFYQLVTWDNSIESYYDALHTKEIPQEYKNIGVLTLTPNNAHHFYYNEIRERLRVDATKLLIAYPETFFKIFLWGNYIFFNLVVNSLKIMGI